MVVSYSLSVPNYSIPFLVGRNLSVFLLYCSREVPVKCWLVVVEDLGNFSPILYIGILGNAGESSGFDYVLVRIASLEQSAYHSKFVAYTAIHIAHSGGWVCLENKRNEPAPA